MTVANWLFQSMEELGKAGVDSPRRDALVLLEDSLGKDRAWVLAHPEFELDVNDTSFQGLEQKIARRIKREPLAYIRGKVWFYGRFFEVDHSVLIPRPESEAFINLLKETVKSSDIQVVDIGTGSGCLAITTKLEFPDFSVSALDISEAALECAQKNARAVGADVDFIKSDLLSNISQNIDSETVLLSNLPYVPAGLITSPEIKQEPAIALFSGKDGLDHYRKLWAQIASLKSKPGYVLTESLQDQHASMQQLSGKSGYELKKAEQLTQLFVRT